MYQVRDKKEPYRKAVFADPEIIGIEDTPKGKTVKLRQQSIDFYYPKNIQEFVIAYLKEGIVPKASGFFGGDLATYIKVAEKNKTLDVPIQKLVNYQGITYNAYDQFVGLALRYPIDEPSYRYANVWFRDFEAVQRVFNIEIGNSFIGHIVAAKFDTPQYEGHEPLKTSVGNIYYVCEWSSVYKLDMDYRGKNAQVEDEMELTEYHHVAVPINMDNKIIST